MRSVHRSASGAKPCPVGGAICSKRAGAADLPAEQGAGGGGLSVRRRDGRRAAIEGGCEEMPLAGREAGGGGELVALAHPERDLARASMAR